MQHTGNIFGSSAGHLPSLDANLEGVEDPYLWEAKDGTFHMLVHGDCGYHAFSEDGLLWHTSARGGVTCAFPREHVPREGGSAVSFGRRERPHLVLGPDGFTPVALTTAVTGPGGGDHSWTLVQAIGSSSSTAGRAPATTGSVDAGVASSTRSGSAAAVASEITCGGGNIMTLSVGHSGGPSSQQPSSRLGLCGALS